MIPSDSSVGMTFCGTQIVFHGYFNAVRDDANIKLPSVVAANMDALPFIMFLVRELLQPARKQTIPQLRLKIPTANTIVG